VAVAQPDAKPFQESVHRLECRSRVGGDGGT
jgi:hypothetical protein